MHADLLLRGIALFNQGRYFDAHEVLEDVWRESSGRERLFLQAVIQVAVALHHHSTGNHRGARSLLRRAARRLAGYPEQYSGLEVAPLRQALDEWLGALEAGSAPPGPPRLETAADVKISDSMSDSPTAKAPARSAGVPLLDLGRQYAAIGGEVLAAIERVCQSQKFILGEEVAEFERAVAAYVGTRECVACASGTDALWLSLIAAGIEPGDEVITTTFSFFASASAIVRAGARPVLLDVDPQTLNLDPKLVERKVTGYCSGRLRVLLPVHLFGQCADMDQFARLGKQYGLVVIEDAAQAFGAGWRGRRAGSLSTAAAFSFYPTKNLSAFGDGGCITTGDAALAERLRRLRNHGSRQRYYHDEVGWNSRLDAIQAAILRVKLNHIDSWNAQRRERAAAYDRLFAEAGLLKGPVRLLGCAQPAHHVYHQYVVRCQRRDDLRRSLSERGIGTEVYYPLPLHLQAAFSYLGYAAGDFPEAERAAREVLALPMFPELTLDEQRTVVDAIAEFYS